MVESDIRKLWFDGISLEPEDTVVEIGAFTGKISLKAAAEYGLQRVYAIEASKRNFDVLCTNCCNTPVIPINLAIGAKDGVSSFVEFEGHSSSNSLIQESGTYSREGDTGRTAKPVFTEVRTLTLFSFLKKTGIKEVGLLFMNCEGAEKYILPQIVETSGMIDRIRTISIEFHPQLLGQTSIMRLIKLLATNYKPRIVTRSLRGPLNMVFTRRASEQRMEFKWCLLYLRACFMDAIWPFLTVAKKYKNKLTHNS
jgi:FkbM family methyltransferase